MNDMPTFVASTTLSEPLEWKNSTLLKGDVAEAVRELKEGDGKAIQVIGSGELAQTLMANDLVDEYRLMVYPVVLGAGKRLFREGGPRIALKLVDGSITTKGVQILTYRPEREE
jgi:dihydrofolate reductase